MNTIFDQLMLVLASSVVFVAILRRLHLPSILGYLVIGIVLGVFGREHFKQLNDLSVLAKFGVVFLLFSVGLEFSIQKLIALKKAVFIVGSLQVFICWAVVFFVAYSLHASIAASFVVAAILALSSTALISKILSESGQLQTNTGRVTISILIFQDIAVVPFLIITGVFAEHTQQGLLYVIVRELVIGCVTFIALFWIGQKLLTPLFDIVSKLRSPELFMLTVLLTALSAAFITEAMGLSKELGAFLAGVILAGTPYCHQVDVDIRPFRDILLGLFFIGIGMLFHPASMGQIWYWIILVALAMMALKAIVVPLLVYYLGNASKEEAWRSGFYLSQGGEFGFVLLSISTEMHLLNTTITQVILGALILSMILSLMLIRFQEDILKIFFKQLETTDLDVNNDENMAQACSQMRNHVVICGYGAIGQHLAGMLRSQAIPYVAFGIDTVLVRDAALAGDHVYYGDVRHREILEIANIKKAAALVISFNDVVSAKTIIQHVKELAPKTKILVRARDDQAFEQLKALEVEGIAVETLETGLMLSSQLLTILGVSSARVRSLNRKTRDDRYCRLRGYFVSEEQIREGRGDLPQLHSIFISADSPICGVSVQALPIQDLDVTVTRVRRGDEEVNVTPTLKIEARDVLVLFGSLDAIDKAESAIRYYSK